MYDHELIMVAVQKIRKDREMSTTELAGQMAHAIHVMLEFSEVGFDKLVSEIQSRGVVK